MTKILITDDQADLRCLMRWSLEAPHVHIDEAADGEEALKLARSLQPDLMVLDVMMPGELDGLQVCRLIKSDPDLSSVRVILLSARGQVADVRQGTDAGADAYIVKPFSPQRLVETVARLLSPTASSDPQS